MTESNNLKNEPKGLGGWLILPAIGLIVSPIRLGYGLFTEMVPIFQEGYWEILTTPGTEAYHPLWGPLIIFETVGNTAFILFDLILIFLFFTKSHRFPILMITFLIASLVFVVADWFFADLIPMVAAEDNSEVLGELVRSLISCMIWVPYFLVSKRVKNTFVKPGGDREPLPGAIGTA